MTKMAFVDVDRTFSPLGSVLGRE